MIKRVAVLAGVLFLAGCAVQPTIPSASLRACKGLKSTTEAMTEIKPELPVQTQNQIGEALHTAAGYCLTPNPPKNANSVVSGILNSLDALAKQMAKQKQGTTTGATK